MPVLALGSCVEPDTGLWSQDTRSWPRLPSCLSVSPAVDLGTREPRLPLAMGRVSSGQQPCR